jgi:hypothetical protein
MPDLRHWNLCHKRGSRTLLSLFFQRACVDAEISPFLAHILPAAQQPFSMKTCPLCDLYGCYIPRFDVQFQAWNIQIGTCSPDDFD